jgi:class 3 adenylate cyclase
MEHMMNVVARMTLRALQAHGVTSLPTYRRALISACNVSRPPFGRKAYGDLYRESAVDPDWVALSLVTAAQSEGEGARHLWDMAACTQDTDIASRMQGHAIDEARHSRGYVALIELIFPEAVDEKLRKQLHRLSPGYTKTSPLTAAKGSPYAYPATVDELIQMNIAEIRTRIYHLERPGRSRAFRTRSQVGEAAPQLVGRRQSPAPYETDSLDDDGVHQRVNGMWCQHCQHHNPLGGKFCAECGTRLEIRCPACGTANVTVNNTCRACGGPLTQEPPGMRPVSERYTRHRLTEMILTSKTALEGERKQITVLFADMKGSMELIADRDPEEARKVLNPVLERMMESVHRYEGTVSEVMGDGIMALFGAPLAHEDHGIRACYAALRMQEAVKRYAQEIQRTHGVPIQIRVGLDSGEVVVCTIGNELRMDYTAGGHTTHLAARMEQAAMPGSTLITSSTLRLAEGYVQVKALGKIQIKGLSEAVEAYELTGAQPARTRLQAAASRGLTRFVGRHVELDRLRMAWQQAAAGYGQVVALVGEPGVGKSRLFYEFARSLPRESWLIIESGSVSHGKATAYSLVIELLKDYFKVHDRDDHRAIRDKVTTKLFALDESLNSSTSALLALLDTPSGDVEWEKLDPQFRREKTLDAVKRLLLRESEVQPLLVVFEDLHVVDFETQAVLRAWSRVSRQPASYCS